jgi:hypothetical protein
MTETSYQLSIRQVNLLDDPFTAAGVRSRILQPELGKRRDDFFLCSADNNDENSLELE